METNQVKNTKYCSQCGMEILQAAEICPHCGVRQYGQPSPNNYNNNFNKTDREWLITIILCLLAGTLGVHNFYNRKVGLGILQLLTLGGCGIWTLIDLILIALGRFKNNEGQFVTSDGLINSK